MFELTLIVWIPESRSVVPITVSSIRVYFLTIIMLLPEIRGRCCICCSLRSRMPPRRPHSNWFQEICREDRIAALVSTMQFYRRTASNFIPEISLRYLLMNMSTGESYYSDFVKKRCLSGKERSASALKGSYLGFPCVLCLICIIFKELHIRFACSPTPCNESPRHSMLRENQDEPSCSYFDPLWSCNKLW